MFFKNKASDVVFSKFTVNASSVASSNNLSCKVILNLNYISMNEFMVP